MSATVAVDFEFQSPITRVWRALTDPATLSKWMLFDTEDFRPVVGHTVHFRSKPETGWPATVDCQVLAVEEPRLLSYTWAIPALSHHTTVTWTLTAAPGGVTRVHLEQSGFAADAHQETQGAQYGWTQQLKALERLLASA